MRSKILSMFLAIGALGLCVVMMVEADEPMFVRWLVVDDPGDETIRNYWERAERGELEATELVDLGTMLFARGYPKDAIRNYQKALELDPELYEAWFRIGLVEHSQGRLREARKAYKKCLKQLTGHGWCNFYLGLLEEQWGHSEEALDAYRRAFKFAPELSNPKVNPEMLTSDLAFAAKLREYDRVDFSDTMPMRYLEPKKVARVRRSYETEAEQRGSSRGTESAEDVVKDAPATDEPTPEAESQSRSGVTQGTSGGTDKPPSVTSGGSSATTPSATNTGESRRKATAPRPTPRSDTQPFGMPPPVRSTSPEARLLFEIPGLWEIAAILV